MRDKCFNTKGQVKVTNTIPMAMSMMGSGCRTREMAAVDCSRGMEQSLIAFLGMIKLLLNSQITVTLLTDMETLLRVRYHQSLKAKTMEFQYPLSALVA